MSGAFVLSAVRTAIGDYGGRLKDEPPTRLAAAVVREAVSRAGVPAKQVGHVVFGNVIHTDPIDMYLARVAALQGGLTEHTPALTVNRLCGSGLQAVLSASEYVMQGHAGSCRGRNWRWCRVDEPIAIRISLGSLGAAHGRGQALRHDARRAD